MILKAVIEDQLYTLNVPDVVLAEGQPFFCKMDEDMSGGWQMSRDWVAQLSDHQRCQIVADKLLTALETDNHKLGTLMAGYLLHKLPSLEQVDIDIHGEIQNTRFSFREADPLSTAPEQTQARAQAEREVTPVFKVGKVYRFSVLDPATGHWRDSPAFASEEEAKRQRRSALQIRSAAFTTPRD
jgi:hypothetical protein